MHAAAGRSFLANPAWPPVNFPEFPLIPSKRGMKPVGIAPTVPRKAGREFYGEGVAVRVLTRLPGVLAVTLAATALWALPAAANTQVRTVIHVDDTFVDDETCGFDITVHVFGPFTDTDFYDNSGFLYKTIETVGPGGPFTITETAKGTTLTMPMQSFQVTITYNADGSPATFTNNGLVTKFTLPGGGVVLLDTGRVTFDREGNILFEAGPHQQLHGDVDAFCAAFG